MKNKCEWERKTPSFYRTSCDQEFYNIYNVADLVLTQNKFIFCPFCGQKMEVTKTKITT